MFFKCLLIFFTLIVPICTHRHQMGNSYRSLHSSARKVLRRQFAELKRDIDQSIETFEVRYKVARRNEPVIEEAPIDVKCDELQDDNEFKFRDLLSGGKRKKEADDLYALLILCQ